MELPSKSYHAWWCVPQHFSLLWVCGSAFKPEQRNTRLRRQLTKCRISSGQEQGRQDDAAPRVASHGIDPSWSSANIRERESAATTTPTTDVELQNSLPNQNIYSGRSRSEFSFWPKTYLHLVFQWRLLGDGGGGGWSGVGGKGWGGVGVRAKEENLLSLWGCCFPTTETKLLTFFRRSPGEDEKNCTTQVAGVVVFGSSFKFGFQAKTPTRRDRV